MNIYIDGENISYKSFNSIKNKYLEESHKILAIKIYGDWSREDMKKWYTLCKTYSIDQKQCINIPKKGAVDFNIVIDIMDDIYNDIILKTKILKKIFIVSSDSDFMHIHNRIVKFNIEAEVYSPQDYQSNKYKDHDKLFEYDTSITIDNNNPAITNSYFQETVINTHEDTEYYSESDIDEDNDDVSDVTSESCDMNHVINDKDDEECDYFDEKNVEDCMKNILICFRWINKKKKPYKAVNIDEFNKIYIELAKTNMLYPVTNFSKLYNYLFYTNKMTVDNSNKKNITIKPKYFDEIFYKYGLINVKLNDLLMSYKYNNLENKPIPFNQLYNNMQLLKGKNVLLEKLMDKCKLEYNLKNNMYVDFELKRDKGKKQYVFYNK